VQIVSADLPGQRLARVGAVFAGMLDGQDPGTLGTLRLDEFSFGDP
jgi:hypothetical protein